MFPSLLHLLRAPSPTSAAPAVGALKALAGTNETACATVLKALSHFKEVFEGGESPQAQTEAAAAICRLLTSQASVATSGLLEPYGVAALCELILAVFLDPGDVRQQTAAKALLEVDAGVKGQLWQATLVDAVSSSVLLEGWRPRDSPGGQGGQNGQNGQGGQNDQGGQGGQSGEEEDSVDPGKVLVPEWEGRHGSTVAAVLQWRHERASYRWGAFVSALVYQLQC